MSNEKRQKIQGQCTERNPVCEYADYELKDIKKKLSQLGHFRK